MKTSPLADYNPLDKIVSALYMLPLKVQFCHHLTTSYAAHKALDTTYDTLNDLKDSIVEKLIGYSQRFSKVNLESLDNYSETMNNMVAVEIMNFGKKLESWAAENEYCDIENLAQEYSGAGAQLKYLLTLK